MLPLVSKHFAAAVRDPTLWETVRIVHEDHGGRGMSSKRMRSWIAARARCIKHMELRYACTVANVCAHGL